MPLRSLTRAQGWLGGSYVVPKSPAKQGRDLEAAVCHEDYVVCVPLIAGCLDSADVLNRLRAVRPLFHSEADLQHALGQVVYDLDGSLQVRLEVKQEAKEYLDLLCSGPSARTAIELKYRTRKWAGLDAAGEAFDLLDHSATDLGRQSFVHDIARLERFCRVYPGKSNGLAMMLTNEPAYWSPPRGTRITRDKMFRIHEGQELTGVLRWGDNDVESARRTLAGSYAMRWQDWSDVCGPGNHFRALVVEVEGG